MNESWKRDILVCPKTGKSLSGDWPKLVNGEGTPLLVDDLGIVRANYSANEGINFHELMDSGTTLRSLQYRPLHLAYWETPYYKKAITHFIGSVNAPNSVAMDVGCGDGRFTELLIELGYERVVGVDANLSSLRSLAYYATNNGFRDKLLLVHASADNLPIRTCCIDLAISIGVLYYLNERYEIGLQEVVETLKPQADLIASEPDLEGTSIKALLFESIDDFLRTVNQRVFSEFHEGNRFKFRVFDRQEVQDIYRSKGLDVLGFHGLSIFPSLLRIMMIRGQTDTKEVAAMETEIREAFDYFDKDGFTYKHIIWHCRKGA